MKKCVWSVLLLLLLTACYGEPATTPSPEELWGKPLDERHIACYIDVAGEKGQLLVTGELCRNNIIEISIWDPQDMSQPLQQFFELGENGLGEFVVTDVNFDGSMDLIHAVYGVKSAVDTMNSLGLLGELGDKIVVDTRDYTRCSLWLWNGETEAFEPSEELLRFRNVPLPDMKKQLLFGEIQSFIGGEGTAYGCCVWEAEALICKRVIEVSDPGEDGTQTLTVYDTESGGGLWEATSYALVFSEKFGAESEAWYQELERWRDLSYPGE